MYNRNIKINEGTGSVPEKGVNHNNIKHFIFMERLQCACPCTSKHFTCLNR